MTNNIKWYQWAIVLIAMATTIYLQFSSILHSPSSMLFTSGGDGLKNYLTPLLHVKNSTSYNHFDSMNYPYGEHVLFTDNQPLISNILRFFQRNFNDVAYHTTGVLNLLMLLSLFFTGVLLYSFFRRLQLPHWYSMPVAISVAWLSPQLGRFMGHYALSYMIIILLLLYLLMRFENRSWKWSLSILALVFFAPLLHFYYFGISAVFLSFFYFVKVWKEPNSFRFYLQHWVIQLFIPFAFFNLIWLNIGNPVTDRPAFPMGFLQYVATWEGTFLNYGNWIYDFIHHYCFAITKTTEFESLNYIGFAAFLFCLLRIISWVFSFKLKMLETEQGILPEKNFLITAFWASILLYIFSLGVPFIFPKCEFLLDYTGPLKQFRGLARFSWMFYFIINIIAFYAIYHWGAKIKNIEFRRAYWVLFLAIAALEAVGNARKLSQPVSIYAELTATDETIEDWKPFVDNTKYQAILPIPYYHLGAEYLGIQIQGSSLAYNLLPSYYGNLPSMGVMMSRTSWQQSLNSIPLGLELYREPPVLKELPNQKPLLVIEYKKWHAELGNRYQNILAKGKKIHENAAFAMYELPIDAYRNTLSEKSLLIKQEAQNLALFQQNNLLSKDKEVNYVYKTFDDVANEVRYRGNGALSFSAKEKKIVFFDKIPAQQKGKKYTLRFWQRIEKGEHLRSSLIIKEIDKKNEQQFFWHYGNLYYVVTLDEKWALIEVPLEAHYDDTKFEISIENAVKTNTTMCIDELMIYPENNILYQVNQNETMKNGMWYSK